MTGFELAEIYVKEILAMSIELSVKNLNLELQNDKIVPNTKILVTGGQAIQTYFPSAAELRTHDFDLKLVAPSATPYTQQVRDRLLLLSRGVARYIEITLNNYIKTILDTISKTLITTYGVKLLVESDGKVFTASSNLRNNYLKVITFRLQQGRRIRTNSICDVYVVDPSELREHYLTFTGLPGSNPILSENRSEYYIPYQEINGIPYASMGYVIWDSIRMVNDSRERGLPKYPRYVAKRDAIINALNRPIGNLSCNSMKQYMLNCEKEYKGCVIDGKKYDTVNSLIRYGISEGYLPLNKQIIEDIKATYDINYLCSSLKRMAGK